MNFKNYSTKELGKKLKEEILTASENEGERARGGEGVKEKKESELRMTF